MSVKLGSVIGCPFRPQHANSRNATPLLAYNRSHQIPSVNYRAATGSAAENIPQLARLCLPDLTIS
jgi:hypothetical protein